MSEERKTAMREALRSFLEIRVYQKKLVGIVCATLLFGVICLGGATVFFTGIWAGNQAQEMQNAFTRAERRQMSVKEQLESYVDSIYASRSMMQDAKALFEAASEQEYLEARKNNSRMSSEQIAYLPGDLKRLFINNRTEIKGVTIRSGSGMKALWLDPESGDIKLAYGMRKESAAEAIPGFGDTPFDTVELRDANSISKIMGKMTFWLDKEDLFQDAAQEEGWAAFHLGTVFYGNYRNDREKNALLEASGQTDNQGWFFTRNRTLTTYLRFDAGRPGDSYVWAESYGDIWRANQKGLIALLVTIALLAAGAIAISFVGLCHEAWFLSRIMKMLKAMECGNFQEVTGICAGSSNEYGVIAGGLLEVSGKLKGYIEKEYILKLKQQEAAMRALQNQINPHFLYNTLESIRARALMLGDGETAEAIGQLGSLYRGVVRAPGVITLKEEFAQLKLYLKLMSLRHGGSFVYQLELDEEAGKTQTVSFWLQPLAENFFNHGFDRNSEFNLLVVEGGKRKQAVELLMTDNGIGIPEERLSQIRRNMVEGTDEAGADIGLRNVYQRLTYYYGPGFSMEISNNPEGGVRIRVVIPCI